MKSRLLPLCAAVAGGVPAFLLRLAQNRTGFDAQALPVPGNLPALLLPLLLAALAVLLLALTRTPAKDGRGCFPADFFGGGAGALTLVIGGVFLMAVSGAFVCLGGFPTPESGMLPPGELPSRLTQLTGALSLAAAASLLPAAVACRRSGGTSSGGLLLCPVVCLVVQLVLVYRARSANPVLGCYYIELLALIALIMAFYRLSAFGVQAGKTRGFAFWTCAAVVLALTLAADGLRPSLLLYLGGAAAQAGFLVLRLQNEAARAVPPDAPLPPDAA